MVESGRGVAVLPRWLAEEYAEKMDVVGVREADVDVDYLKALVALARRRHQ